ncbi:glycoside hydrolase family 18 protein [Hypoxylon fragiforme]|uniref:glycoside hydrolase family 18 protein n=1 Tax=Hypoxylon fragiforme TaxID=63214 RepID=UPI0020C69FE7|nr:glycoside hydrolase family 18 protein [Hypoxylon fragiforme]KAI2603956.1 glycoside hydrolase family 18 protein [Hypoxylon fragiforme]
MHIPRAVTTAAAATPRFAMYYDQWHTASPNKAQMAGITHVITAFASTTLFTSDPPGTYTPFVDVATLRSQFDDGTKICMAIGGWGDTAGFSVGQKDDASRKLYAKNVASTLESHGYDCVDVDWEYPGGNGEDYKQNPNSGKTDEIANYALLLQEIKSAIGDKELSIAVPGLERDMIAFTSEQVPKIDAAVDVINVMTYDLMNRRDTQTSHHTSVKGSLSTIDHYISLGMTPSKMNLGIAFYAKFFKTTGQCTQPIGCPTVLLEDANGGDTGQSGAVTFAEVPPVLSSGVADADEGGQWYWDASTSYFWTWDTPDFIAQKFEQIVGARGLGGVMAWSLGEDSADLTYIKAMQSGLATL